MESKKGESLENLELDRSWRGVTKLGKSRQVLGEKFNRPNFRASIVSLALHPPLNLINADRIILLRNYLLKGEGGNSARFLQPCMEKFADSERTLWHARPRDAHPQLPHTAKANIYSLILEDWLATISFLRNYPRIRRIQLRYAHASPRKILIPFRVEKKKYILDQCTNLPYYLLSLIDDAKQRAKIYPHELVVVNR